MKKSLGPEAFLETFIALKRCFVSIATEVYGDAAMGSIQVTFLRHVARHGPISQAELARATSTDPALAGRALQGMIERGAVRRERSQSDRREYLLELGPKGAESLAQAERLRMRLAERLARPLDSRDREDFERIARKLLDASGVQAEVMEMAPPRGTLRVPAAAKRADAARTSPAKGSSRRGR